MDDGRQWSTMAILTWGAWMIVAAMILSMWVALAVERETFALAAGLTAGVLSAVAGTLHIRRFATKTQELVRELHAEARERERDVFEMGRDSVIPLRPPR